MNSMNSDTKLANAFGAKSARACDNCIRKRARWYCAADDAFLCQSCDSSVHSVNYLARRHERVRLKIASIKSLDAKFHNNERFWHKGFIKKARTPRQKKHVKFINRQNPPHLVPCSTENSREGNEEQLLRRVPSFDQSASELCNSTESADNTHVQTTDSEHDSKDFSDYLGQESYSLQGIPLSEMDLAEFSVDIENLLGKGLDKELFSMEGLGFVDCDEIETEQLQGFYSVGCERVKVETGGANFDYDSAITGERENKNLAVTGEPILMDISSDSKKNQNFLRLDYEAVISNWDGEKSPWTTGERPELDSGDCWPDNLGKCGGMGDAGREARVSRYREKRRNRLFSKKIRYEVRKLNAEKRPRMKGRFVKRPNFATNFPLLST